MISVKKSELVNLLQGHLTKDFMEMQVIKSCVQCAQ